jgi:hypothetical protein
MLDISVAALVLAASLGAVLATRQLRPSGARSAATALRAAHGGLGGAGVLAALAALRPLAATLSAVLLDAAVLLATALASGLLYWLFAGRLGAARGLVLTLHGFVAALGVALLAGWAFGQ